MLTVDRVSRCISPGFFSRNRGGRLQTLGFVVFCLAGGTVLFAGEPSLRVGLEPQRLGVEDLTRLTVQVIDPGNDRPVPDLGQLVNFEVVQGPSTETRFSWVNGKSTSAISLSWILRPQGVGSAVVGPITVTLGARTLAGGAVTAEIVPGSLHQQQRSRRRPSPFGVTDPFSDFFGVPRQTRQAKVELRQLLSRARTVDGEPIIAEVVLDTTGGVDGFEWVDVPEYPGWWVQRLENPERVDSKVVEVNGEKFNRFVLARHVLIPLKPGTLTIPAVSARIGFRGGSVFSPHTVLERSTGTITVEVTPRPPAPQGFSGAVGHLRYSVELEPDTIDFGESAVVTVTLEGRGNLPLVGPPASWPACAECEAYPPEEENAVTIDSTGIHGSRMWRTTLVPRRPGRLNLGAVELAVFNPTSGTYEAQRLGPLTLTVKPPPPTPTPVGTPPAPKALDPNRPNEKGATGEPRRKGGSGPSLPLWLVVGSALAVGVLGGGLLAWLMTRGRSASVPPRRNGQSPADRARELQLAMEQWWVGLPDDRKSGEREAEMRAVRKGLETIRFAPGRADHSETIRDLEKRLRALMR